jgi:hypothetical protein
MSSQNKWKSKNPRTESCFRSGIQAKRLWRTILLKSQAVLMAVHSWWFIYFWHGHIDILSICFHNLYIDCHLSRCTHTYIVTTTFISTRFVLNSFRCFTVPIRARSLVLTLHYFCSLFLSLSFLIISSTVLKINVDPRSIPCLFLTNNHIKISRKERASIREEHKIG